MWPITMLLCLIALFVLLLGAVIVRLLLRRRPGEVLIGVTLGVLVGVIVWGSMLPKLLNQAAELRMREALSQMK